VHEESDRMVESDNKYGPLTATVAAGEDDPPVASTSNDFDDSPPLLRYAFIPVREVSAVGSFR
jgi:hypothetical protein